MRWPRASRAAGRSCSSRRPPGSARRACSRRRPRRPPRQGFTCLRARATELERDFAYGCVRQLLEPAVAKVVGRRARPPVRRRRGPVEAAVRPERRAAAAASRPTAPFSMLHGLYWLLNNLADEGPLALVVDDLHWSDTESLRFLNYLAPRLDGLPLAVLASTRSGETASRRTLLGWPPAPRPRCCGLDR